MTMLIRCLISISIFLGVTALGGYIGARVPINNVPPQDVTSGDGIGILFFGAAGLLIGGAIGLLLAGIYWIRSYRRGKI